MGSLKDAVNRIRPAVVQIGVSASLPDGKALDRVIAGTGFFVSQGQYVATAAHVIQKTKSELTDLGANQISFNARIPQKDIESTIKARRGFMDVPIDSFEFDEVNDLALLRLPAKIGREGLHLKIEAEGKTYEITEVKDATLHSGRLSVGEEIAVAGFPLRSAYMLIQHGIVSAIPVLPIPGSEREHEEIVTDIMIHPGNSGGPAFLAHNGKVLGVCRAHQLAPILSQDQDRPTLYQHAGLSLITPVRFLLELLDKQGIPHKVE